MSGPLLQGVQALPIGSAPIGYTAQLYVHDWSDPLLPAVTRFVAARPFTGPRALMRRFDIGLQRARGLLTVLVERRLVRGHWCRQAAIASLSGCEVFAFRRYRVQSWAWAQLQGGV